MKWETKNRINNINQLNQIRQKNRTLKNKPIEEPKEERVESEYNPQKFIEFCELQMGIKLHDYQKQFIEKIFNRDYYTLVIPRYNGYATLLGFLQRYLEE